MIGAKNGTRTRDPDLGKVVLYQLSYFRVGQPFFLVCDAKLDIIFIPTKCFCNYFSLLVGMNYVSGSYKIIFF